MSVAGTRQIAKSQYSILQSAQMSRQEEELEAAMALAHERRHSAPREFEARALANVRAAEELPVTPKGHDRQAAAWGDLGNARRICGNFPGARQALTAAWERAGQGTGTRCVAAKLHEIEASLELALHHPLEAARQLRAAVHLRCDNGHTDVHGAVACLLKLALIEGDDSPEVGLQTLAQAFVILHDRWHQYPILTWDAIHNACVLLVDGGAVQDAVDVLLWLQVAGIPVPDCPGRRRRARWLEGKVAAALGEYEAAVCELRAVRDAYAAEDLPVETALVGLELALAQAQAGHLETARESLGEIGPLFLAIGLEAESEAVRMLAAATDAAALLEIVPRLILQVRRDAATSPRLAV